MGLAGGAQAQARGHRAPPGGVVVVGMVVVVMVLVGVVLVIVVEVELGVVRVVVVVVEMEVGVVIVVVCGTWRWWRRCWGTSHPARRLPEISQLLWRQ